MNNPLGVSPSKGNQGTTRDCLESPRQTVHVSIFGSDTKTCGTSLEPCRTIAMAVDQVDWGGRIVLNGNGTKQQPFDCACESTIQNSKHSGIRVLKSLTITTLDSTLAYVSCLKGIHFHRSNERLWITLTGIAFFGAPLKFIDISNISLINCSLQNTQQAVTVRVEKSLNANLIIRGSIFQNNSLCVEIHFVQGSGTDIKFSLHLTDTKILKNGLNATNLARGGVVLRSETGFSTKIRLRLKADKIVCAANKGHFLFVHLPTAVSIETYNSIYLNRNHYFLSRSLYYSNVEMANVVFVRLQCTNNYEVTCLTIHGSKKQTLDVRVSESRFYNNNVSNSKREPISSFWVIGTGARAGTIKISNTTFDRNNIRAVKVTPNFRVTLDNVTVSSSMDGVVIKPPVGQLLNENGFQLDVVVNNCTFRNNQYDLSAMLNNSINVSFIVTNTLFDGRERIGNQSTFGIRVIIPYLERTNVSAATKIEIENVTFIERPSNSFALVFKGTKTINIRRCIFRDSFTVEIDKWQDGHFKNMPSYETSQGALLFLFDSDEMVERGCVQSNVTANTHPTWRYTSHVLFEDTFFQNNSGKISGAVQIVNGYVEFQSCSFIDNFSERDFGQVYVGYGSAKVEFKSCVFKRTRKKGTYQDKQRHTFEVGRFLHSESGGPLKIENTSFHSHTEDRDKHQAVLRIYSGGYFDMDQSSTIQCAIGSYIQFKNLSHFIYRGGKGNNFCRINVTTELFSCRMCPPKMYSLEKGFFIGLAIHKYITCLKCPFGAHCNGPNNILAKPNFWGYKITNGSNFSSLKFLPCPWEYCRHRDPDSYHENGYNSCHGFRSGILCGQCAAGYSETLFSTHCRKSSQCNWKNPLWILMALYSVLLIVYLLKKPSLVLFLKEQILWFRKDGQLTGSLEPSAGHIKEDLEYGYIKIAFFFYQVADLLSTDSLKNTMAKVRFISTVVALFNFEVNVVDRGIGCPFPGLTVVTKELFLSALVFVSIAHVFIIYCLHLAVNMTLRRGKPLFAHYVAVAVEILLLGYDRLAETSLKLMHCVSVGSVWRLYFDGNIVCWQWWQHGLLAYNAIFVVPFVGVLYWGSSKLYNKTISWKGFVGACIVPLPFLVYWFVKSSYRRIKQIRTQIRDHCTDEISKILHGPFRPPSEKDQGTLYWESVLIGERLVLLTFRSFIPNSMLLFLSMSMVCVLMLALHLIKRPFRDPLADKIGTLSLGALTCIAIMNLTTATLTTSAVRPEGPNKHIMEVLSWIIVAIFCFFPMAIALLFVFALLSQLVRFVLFLKRRIYFWFCAPRLYDEYLDDSSVFLTD